MMVKRNRPVRESIHDALQGIGYTLRTQRNMRFHGTMTVLVLIAGFVLKVPALEVLFLLSAIAFVVVTEMINTGIETVVDMITSDYSDLARIAKNVAAGAVLTASLYALVVGYLVLGRRVLFWLF
jgi:diacylglycerol kinase (ATP)